MARRTRPQPSPGEKQQCRILHLIPQDSVGGVEVAARSMAMRRELPCDFMLQLLAGRSLLPDKARVRESRFRSVNNPLAHLDAVFKILSARPEVLICSLWRSMPVGLLVKLLRPQTLLVSFLHLEASTHLLDRVLNDLGMRFSDSVWADSATTLSSRCKKPARLPSCVISFVTERRAMTEPRVPRPAPRFVCWTRLHREKGVDRALRFMALLLPKRPDASFEIWGPDGGERANLERLAVELGIQRNVSFQGPAPAEQLPAIAQRHSFYLQLSHHEGMAMAVVEAMQLGLVPVVAPVGEIQRYCQHRRTGLWSDTQRPEEAVQEVLRLLEDPGEYQAIQREACQYWARAPLYADDVCSAAERTRNAAAALLQANSGPRREQNR